MCLTDRVLLRHHIGWNMTQSITDKILAAITAALSKGAPSGLTVQRSRRRPIEANELPMATVRPLTERVSKATDNVRSPAVKRTLHVSVMIRTTGEDTDLDPIRTFAIQAIMADLTLGGLAIEIEETDHDWQGDEGAESDYIEDLITFAVTYQTARNTPVSK